MTRVHPIPECSPLAPTGRVQPVSLATQAASHLFLSQEVTVLRETPKVRESPRKLLRS